MALTEAKQEYNRFTYRKMVFILAGVIALVLMALVATSLGSADLSVSDVARSVAARIFPFLDIQTTSTLDAIVWDIRLPRILMAILAGAGLAIAGASMQGVMRNPLVSPFTIGISSAAAFGASVAIILGAGLIGTGKYLIIVNAFVFALIAAFLVYGLARFRGMRPETMILAGIALNYFFSAGTSILQYIATEEEVHTVVHWLFGTLTGITWENLLIVTVVLVIGLPILIKSAWDLNALVAGDDMATTLGVNTRRVRGVSMIVSTMVAAVIISFTGIIGFIGLVAPHISRMIVGADHRFLLPTSCMIGAFLLLLADTLGRTAFQPTIIPVGIVISVIGVPFFAYLILRTRKEYFQ
ncbi:MAG: iron ABC transporter permease [Dehalococcoides mccartyi]|uniref:FecCD family ABC transporter permease n=1 Tax=Dehalococcoides mccartyi TaxID=61435 RepID=UPI002431644F|nr:iron ABC transporter permease [Dehalococcoides mccartyi]MCF7635290.1 iron ABC transporter permease [Dehalococcoides mccartyi]